MDFGNLPQKIQEVIIEFIEPFKQDKNVVGIILVGSYANGKPDKNSDIDIYIIEEKGAERERGNLFLKGYEMEYFINPIKQVYNYMDTENLDNPSTVHMLATGIILHEKEGTQEIKKLVSEAKNKFNTPLPKLQTEEIELKKYNIDDLEKDLEDNLIRNNIIGYKYTASMIQIYCIKTFFRLHNKILPKSKKLDVEINKLDPKFSDIVKLTIEKNYSLDSMKSLIGHIEDILGGKRTKEWKLRGPVTYIE